MRRVNFDNSMREAWNRLNLQSWGLANARNLLVAATAFILAALFYLPLTPITLSYFHFDDTMLLDRLQSVGTVGDFVLFVFFPSWAKVRPVANLHYLLEYWTFGENYRLYILWNITLLAVLAHQLHARLTVHGNVLVGIGIAAALALSKFVIYGVWNITGSFELLSAIIFVRTLDAVFTAQRQREVALWAILLILTSEKFLPFAAAAPLLSNYVQTGRLVSGGWPKASASVLGVYLLVRLAFGLPMLVGTQTDNLVESFSVQRFVAHYFSGLLEVLGPSLGPKYLTGIEFPDWVPFTSLYGHPQVMQLLYLSLALLCASLFLLLLSAFWRDRRVHVALAVLLIMLMPAAVTFRVELRWLLPSFLMMLALPLLLLSAPAGNADAVRLKALVVCTAGLFLALLLAYGLHYAKYQRHNLHFAGKLSVTTMLGK